MFIIPTVTAFMEKALADNCPYPKPKVLAKLRCVGKLVDDFLDFKNAENPDDPKDWSEPETWEANFPVQKSLGTMLGQILVWCSFHRRPTLSLVTMYHGYNRMIYAELFKRYGEARDWSTIANPTAGLLNIRATNDTYMKIDRSIKAVMIGTMTEVNRANPMYPQDLARLASVAQPVTKGHRTIAFLYCCYEAAACGIAFITQPNTGYTDLGDGIWSVSYKAAKRAGVELADKQLILSKRASWYFDKYQEDRKHTNGANENTLFGFSNTTEVDNLLEDLCLFAGYPERFFTSHSARAGRLIAEYANSVLNGVQPSVAYQNAHVLGEYSISSDAMRSYIKPLAQRIEFLKRTMQISSINELSVQQIHHTLPQDHLPGPFRYQRIGSNDGASEEQMELTHQLFEDVKQYSKHVSWHSLQSKKKSSFSDTCRVVGTAMRKSGDVDISFLHGMRALQLSSNDVTLEDHIAFGRVVLVMLRNEYLDETNWQQCTVPEHVLSYFSLPPLSINYNQERHVFPEFDTSQSTNAALFTHAYVNRKT